MANPAVPFDPTGVFVAQDVTDGTGIPSAAVRAYSSSAFIRELWEDEIIASYKSNLVMPQLTVTMDHNRKKGDTIHVPNPNRGAASVKSTENSVTLIAIQEEKKQYQIDQHWEYSRLIEDVVTIQADDSLRRFYTDDAGYALAKRVDTQIHAQAAFLNAGDLDAGAADAETQATSAYAGAAVDAGSGVLSVWNPAANANAGNGVVLTDAFIRGLIQTLDDNDSPVSGRYLVIPPVEKNNLLGIPRFTEQAFIGEIGAGNSIRNGRVGDVYGTEVFVSTNIPVVAATDTTTLYRPALMFQEEALLIIEQLRPRAQTQYMQQYLSDLFTSDILFGTGVLRPEGGLALMVPA